MRKNFRNLQYNNCEAPKALFTIFILQINRIAHCYTISALLQLKWSLHNYSVIIPRIARNLSPVTIIYQIYLAGFIQILWIYFIHNSIRCYLYTLNRIVHHIFCNIIKLIYISITTYDNLL